MTVTIRDVLNFVAVLLGVSIILLVVITSQFSPVNPIYADSNTISLNLSRNGYLAQLPQFERTDWQAQFSAMRAAYPARISIPMLDIQSDILGVGVDNNGLIIAPPRRVGHFMQSARPSEANNIVLVGHSGTGLVFEHLFDVQVGDSIVIFSMDATEHTYIVDTLTIVPVKDASLVQAQANIEMIMPTDSEILTLITCYPRDEYTHRLIVHASPAKAKP